MRQKFEIYTLIETTSIPTPFIFGVHPREPSCLYSVWKTNWNLESIKVVIKKWITSVHQVHLCIDWDACILQLFLFFRHKEKWDPFARGSNPRGDNRDFKWQQEPITRWKGWSKDFLGWENFVGFSWFKYGIVLGIQNNQKIRAVPAYPGCVVPLEILWLGNSASDFLGVKFWSRDILGFRLKF